jgi:ABC-type Fe3+/spermidine/putrescine transport system ATPase subunit
VQKRFRAVHAVEDFDLSPQGRVRLVPGPSGCGKTTTLRMIAGFEHPDAGTIRSTARTSPAAPNKRNVGMVFQAYACSPT